jgi:hypothetical protein
MAGMNSAKSDVKRLLYRCYNEFHQIHHEKERVMPKPNYKYEKRQKEIAKQKKKEEKLKRKEEKKKEEVEQTSEETTEKEKTGQE